jgi:hypothetical protein
MEEGDSDSVKCPFCGYERIPSVSGKTICQKCGASFEIDGRGERVFVDPLNGRLPLEGTFCPVCGLIQGGEAENCLLCKAKLYRKDQ